MCCSFIPVRTLLSMRAPQGGEESLWRSGREKSSPPSRACRRNTPSCYRRKRRRMPNTGVRAMRCASCCSTSRTWIVCWAKTSARRRRKRSMTGNNGHTPKRFAETRSRAYCAFKGGVAPDKQRGVFAAAKIPRKCKRGTSLPRLPIYVCCVCKFGLKIALLSWH